MTLLQFRAFPALLSRSLPRFGAVGALVLGLVKYSVLALLLFVCRSHAQVSILGSTVSATETTGSSATKTMSFTVPAGNNRLLVVTTGGGGNVVGEPTVTYGGTNMTKAVVLASTSSIRTGIWYRALGSSASPTTANVVVTYGGNYFFSVTATAFQGVDQTTPVSGATSAGSQSISVTSAAGDCVIDAIIGDGTAASVEAGAGQALQAKDTGLVFGQTHAGVSTATGGASVTMSWTGYTTNIAHVGINLRHAFVAAPTVTGVSPTSGPAVGGTPVTITGTGLSGATSVTFGAIEAISFTVNSATQITATAPSASAGTVNIAVTTFGGTSVPAAGNQFVYIAAPTVTGISPASGPAAGGTSVTITGTDLSGATSVTFGSSNATSYTINSASQITATSPAGSLGSTVDVQVTTVGGTSATSSADQFAYVSIAPVVGNLGGDSVTLTEGGSAVLLDLGGNATVTDDDSADFDGGNATVSISSPNGSEDLGISTAGSGVTLFAGMTAGSSVSIGGTAIGTIAAGNTGQDGSNLVVSLSAAATPARVATLLQAITYANGSDDPAASRTVAFTVSDGDGGTSTAANVTVNITAVNDAPSLSATGGTPTYTENGSAVDLFSGVAVSAIEAGQTFTGLTLTVTGVSDGTGEILTVATTDIALTNGNTGAIAGVGAFSVSVTGDTATVTLTGMTRTVATFVSLVDGISYRNASEAPATTTNRVITLTQVKDSGGTENGGVDATTLSFAATVTVVSVNDTPIVTTSGGSAAFVAGDNTPASPVAVDSGMTVTDADNTTLASVLVAITGNFRSGEDVLAFSNSNTTTYGNISPTYNASTGVLTLTSEGATATLAQWQAALRAVTFTDTAVTPNTATRTISFTTTDGVTPSATVTRTITVAAVDQTPIVQTAGGITAFTEGKDTASTPVPVDPSLTLADLDNSTLASALVGITANFQSGQDMLAFSNTSAVTYGNIIASYNSGTGVLTLVSSGANATLAQWQAALRSVTFTNSSDSPTTAIRTVEFTVSDGSKSSAAATQSVSVVSVNDTPTNLALSTNSIRRSAAANATIGTLSTTDVDTTDTFTYTLVSGTGDTDNGSFNFSGATLRATNPQALTGGARSVRVRSTDAGGLWCEKVFSITVVDDLRVVTSNANIEPNPALLSLRQAILDLPAGGVISFALPSGSETISLASELAVAKSLTIDGRNTAGSGRPVTLQVATPGSSPWRVFSIDLLSGDTVTLQGLVLKGGDVRGAGVAYGGVLASEGGVLNLTDVTVTGGVAAGGAGIFTASATRAIGCTFTGNAAVGVTGSVGGGGIYAAAEPLLLLNCTIVGNACQTDVGSCLGGGVYCDGPISIINSTITGNTVSGAAPTREGGGVYNRTGSLQVLNSIVAGNQAATGADITTAAAGVTNCYYSWFAGVSGTTIGTQATAPNQTTAYSAGQLSALGNYGGTTQTVRVNADAPAIGHGVFVYEAGGYWFLATDGAYHRLDAYATTVAVEPTGTIGTDQRGFVRTNPPTIGAYQVGLSVAGTITRAGGVAFSGVAVSDGTRTVTTNASGNFVLGDVPPGTYTLTPSSPGYTFTPASRSVLVSSTDISGADFVAAPVPVEQDAQTITFASLADATLGQTVSLSATASSGLPVAFSIVGGPATLSGSTLTTTGVGLVTVRASQAGNGGYNAAPAVERSFLVTVGAPPVVDTPTQVPTPTAGGDATLTVPQTNPNLAYQWQRNGENLAGATSATLALTDVQPPSAGLYTYTATTAAGTGGTSEPVIVGVATEDKVTGTGELVGANIVHPNGNVYDQLILEGHGATFTAEPAQVTRMSYVDLSGDIVQVEFSGAGSLSLVMDDAGTPAPAANYNQPGVNYVRGNPGIVITGADKTTNVSVISVGRINAVNQSLFRDDVAYDGVANIAFIAIQSTNGQFGGVRTGNVEYFAAQGFTGVYAPGVTFHGPVNIGDIQAHDDAQPLLVVGSAANVRIAGGSLAQPNGQPIRVDGLTQVTMAPGQTSQGGALPAQANQGVLQQDGVDVTDLIVMKP